MPLSAEHSTNGRGVYAKEVDSQDVFRIGMSVVFGRDLTILPRSAAAALVISSLVTRPVCLGGPSPFQGPWR
jgi:hypothetical protein